MNIATPQPEASGAGQPLAADKLDIKKRLEIKNLCSRKLLELVREQHQPVHHRQAIADELVQRRHYLEELQRAIGDPTAHRH